MLAVLLAQVVAVGDASAHGALRGIVPDGAAKLTSRSGVLAKSGVLRTAVLYGRTPTAPAGSAMSPEQIRDALEGADSLRTELLASSRGRLSIDVTVFGTYDVANCGRQGCTTQPLTSAAIPHGFSAGNFDAIIYLVADGGWRGGWGEVRGNETWVYCGCTSNQRASMVGVARHELGHNFGLEHAGSFECVADGARVTISPDCEHVEYGDRGSRMGGGYGDFNAWELLGLGWIGADRLTTATSDGTYELRSISQGGSGPLAIRVPRIALRDGRIVYLYLEYRTADGLDTLLDADLQGTVQLRQALDHAPAGGTVRMLDARPDTATMDGLAPGSSASDPITGITVTLVNAADGVATVTIDVRDDGPLADDGPSPPTNPRFELLDDGRMAFRWDHTPDDIVGGGSSSAVHALGGWLHTSAPFMPIQGRFYRYTAFAWNWYGDTTTIGDPALTRDHSLLPATIAGFTDLAGWANTNLVLEPYACLTYMRLSSISTIEWAGLSAVRIYRRDGGGWTLVRELGPMDWEIGYGPDRCKAKVPHTDANFDGVAEYSVRTVWVNGQESGPSNVVRIPYARHRTSMRAYASWAGSCGTARRPCPLLVRARMRGIGGYFRADLWTGATYPMSVRIERLGARRWRTIQVRSRRQVVGAMARVALPVGLRPGRYRVTLRFPGTERFAPSQIRIHVDVRARRR